MLLRSGLCRKRNAQVNTLLPHTCTFITKGMYPVGCVRVCVYRHGGFRCFCEALLQAGSRKHLYRFQKTVVTEEEPLSIYQNSEQRNIATASGN